jgi:hypothetical protein
MSIPESQLETWSHQGSITQSSSTYATIKSALESGEAAYAAKTYDVYLQGSYGNDTNVWSDSDVDVVIQLNSAYYYDDNDLPDTIRNTFRQGLGTTSYAYLEFRRDVLARLRSTFGKAVNDGKRAIFVAGTNARRDADVLPAVSYRRYFLRAGETEPRYHEGLCFFTPDGTKIVNYPKVHSKNCTAKHQATSEWFKPTVRIFKNMRNRAIDSGLLALGLAPSYFIEGMLYNVPTGQFGSTYGQTVFNALTWLRQCDRTTLVCASGRHYLLRDNSPVAWPKAQFETFLTVIISQWNDW